MQSGGAAVEADAIGEQQLAIGEEQPKRTQASGEQQLKRTETGNSSHEADRCNRGAAAEAGTQSGSSSSAQRAVRRRITHVGERGGSS